MTAVSAKIICINPSVIIPSKCRPAYRSGVGTHKLFRLKKRITVGVSQIRKMSLASKSVG